MKILHFIISTSFLLIVQPTLAQPYPIAKYVLWNAGKEIMEGLPMLAPLVNKKLELIEPSKDDFLLKDHLGKVRKQCTVYELDEAGLYPCDTISSNGLCKPSDSLIFKANGKGYIKSIKGRILTTNRIDCIYKCINNHCWRINNVHKDSTLFEFDKTERIVKIKHQFSKEIGADSLVFNYQNDTIRSCGWYPAKPVYFQCDTQKVVFKMLKTYEVDTNLLEISTLLNCVKPKEYIAITLGCQLNRYHPARLILAKGENSSLMFLEYESGYYHFYQAGDQFSWGVHDFESYGGPDFKGFQQGSYFYLGPSMTIYRVDSAFGPSKEEFNLGFRKKPFSVDKCGYLNHIYYLVHVEVPNSTRVSFGRNVWFLDRISRDRAVYDKRYIGYFK